MWNKLHTSVLNWRTQIAKMKGFVNFFPLGKIFIVSFKCIIPKVQTCNKQTSIPLNFESLISCRLEVSQHQLLPPTISITCVSYNWIYGLLAILLPYAIYIHSLFSNPSQIKTSTFIANNQYKSWKFIKKLVDDYSPSKTSNFQYGN